MSCIDLIFCINQNVISKHGVDVSIFDKYHHDLTYDKINIRVPLPPIYVREVWDYKKGNVEGKYQETSFGTNFFICLKPI